MKFISILFLGAQFALLSSMAVTFEGCGGGDSSTGTDSGTTGPVITILVTNNSLASVTMSLDSAGAATIGPNGSHSYTSASSGAHTFTATSSAYQVVGNSFGSCTQGTAPGQTASGSTGSLTLGQQYTMIITQGCSSNPGLILWGPPS